VRLQHSDGTRLPQDIGCTSEGQAAPAAGSASETQTCAKIHPIEPARFTADLMMG